MDAVRGLGFEKRKGTWYLRTPETILVLDLQKSQYSRRYYVNVGVWLQAIEESQSPKSHQSHVVARLTQMVSNPEHVERLLSADSGLSKEEQAPELREVLTSVLSEVTAECATVAELRDSRLVKKALVQGAAQDLLWP